MSFMLLPLGKMPGHIWKTDDTSSDHAVVFIIEDRGLAGSGGTHRLIKCDPDAAVLLHLE